MLCGGTNPPLFIVCKPFLWYKSLIDKREENMKRIFYTIPGVLILSTLLACDNGTQATTIIEEPQEVVEESVTEETSQEVEEPEVEEIEEVAVEPRIILYNDDGSLYVPQHVTLDDFYAKVEECEKSGYFATDWDRDRFVGIALVYNATSMDDEDVITIYKDYLTNYGYNTFKEQYSNHSVKIRNNENIYPFGTYFIDPVLAEEANAFEKYLDANGDIKTEQLICDKLSPFDNYDCMKDNPLICEELNIVYMSEKLSDYYYERPQEYPSFNARISRLMYESDEIDTREELIYKTSEYESSHQE